MSSYNWPPGGGGGGGGIVIPFGQVGSQAVSDASSTVTVTFDAPLSSVNYRVSGSLVNQADDVEDLLFLGWVVTDKTTAGFVVTFNAPMNSANYTFDYSALGDT